MTKDYLKQLIESGDKFALYFQNKGCGYCKEVNKVLKNTLPLTNTDETPTIVHKLMLNEYRELGDSLEVTNTPTLIIVKQQEYTRYVGSEEIINYLNSYNG